MPFPLVETHPHYAWLVGQLSGGILSGIFSMPIESLRVDPAGIMNWQTLLVFVVEGRDQALPIAGIIKSRRDLQRNIVKVRTEGDF